MLSASPYFIQAAPGGRRRGFFQERAGILIAFPYRVSIPCPSGSPILRRAFMRSALPVVNLKEAKYECIFGRGCEGICCKNGRPGLYPEEVVNIDAHLNKF